MPSKDDIDARNKKIVDVFKQMKDQGRRNVEPFKLSPEYHPIASQPKDQLCPGCFEIVQGPLSNHRRYNCVVKDYSADEKQALNAYAKRFGQVGHMEKLEHLKKTRAAGTSAPVAGPSNLSAAVAQATSPPLTNPPVTNKLIQCTSNMRSTSSQTNFCGTKVFDVGNLRIPVSKDEFDGVSALLEILRQQGQTIKGELTSLPLSVAVYKSAVSNPDSIFIIWSKKLEADLIAVARLYPDRISICVTGTQRQNRKCSQNILVSTQISIGDGNEEDLKVMLYSTTYYEQKTHFSSIEDFQKALLLYSKFHKMEHYVRQSCRDLQILKRLDGIKLIICNSVGDT